MTGAELDARLEAIAAELGLESVHWPCPACRVSSHGWPDRVYIGPGGILFRELKGTDDTLSPDQRALGLRLLEWRQDWQVWTPQQLREGTARAQLESIAG